MKEKRVHVTRILRCHISYLFLVLFWAIFIHEKKELCGGDGFFGKKIGGKFGLKMV